MDNVLGIFWGVICIFVVTGIAGEAMERAGHPSERIQACAMADVWDRTGGEFGWPPAVTEEYKCDDMDGAASGRRSDDNHDNDLR